MKYLLLIIGMALSLSACSTTQPSICDTTTDSYLCQIADTVNVRLEDMGNMLVVVNRGAILSGQYTVDESLLALKGIRLALSDPISYFAFQRVVRETVGSTELLLVATTVISHFTSNQEMLDADRAILIGWIDKQIARIE